MFRILALALLFVFATSTPLYAKDKNTSLEDVIRDAIDDDDHPGNGKGRPDNPGEHGRENAEDKQSRGHGNGSKKEDSWEDRIRDEIEDEEKDHKKDKDKNKNKGKGKK